MKRVKLVTFIFVLLSVSAFAQSVGRWSEEKANSWYKEQPFFVGANFIPSTAINQLEMWQAETFDPVTIDRELGWAAAIGMNAMRVYLHHAAWKSDKEGFKKRMKSYLKIAHKHHIATLFVFFDDCWNRTYKTGTQPAPKTGVHNSGWLRDPGDLINTDSTLIISLEAYVKDILTTFSKDKRIMMWDLYNEPNNSGALKQTVPLLKKAFQWASTVRPSQPITSGTVEGALTAMSKLQIENSDIVTYHNYSAEGNHKALIDTLRKFNRPLICTEYMARTNGSRFDNILPLLKQEKVGGFNWGLVSGKTNTIYAWDTPMADGKEPKVWFHDIFRKDGTPFSQEEIDLIKKLTGKK